MRRLTAAARKIGTPLLLLALVGLVTASLWLSPNPENWVQASLTLPPPQVLFFLLMGATLVSEDLTCISAGLLVSQGAIGFVPAALGCFLGIFLGDSLLYLAGLCWGRPALQNRWVRIIIAPEKAARAERFFRQRGPWLILATRFLPGSRLPTYFAAGAMHLRPSTFFLFFALSAALWTPLLVGLSQWLGSGMIHWFQGYATYGFPLFLLTAGLLFFLVRWGESLLTWKGRRLWFSLFQRLTRWEFWPPLAVYPWIVAYYLGLGMKYRSFTLPSLANPGLPLGGWVESKGQILGLLRRHTPQAIGSLQSLPPETNLEQRAERGLAAIHSWPVVIKPDQGERGIGVAILKTKQDLDHYLSQHPEPLIIQQYHGGLEFGVFWSRNIKTGRGQVTSVAAKIPLELEGDGKRTLEELILAHPRAVCKAGTFLHQFAQASQWIPASGQIVTLAPIGSHARGALFLNRPDLNTPALTQSLNALLEVLPEFSLGRFDLKVPSEEDLKSGKNLRILELNGITSEPSHIYHPHYPYWKGIRDLCRQWRLAFKWGDYYRRQGYSPPSLLSLARVTLAHVFREKPKSTKSPPDAASTDAFRDNQQIPISPDNG